MQQRMINRTALLCILFAIAALTVICNAAMNKAVVIEGVAQDAVKDQSGKTAYDDKEMNRLLFQSSSGNGKYLCIPLMQGIKADSVSIENHYMSQELWIFFQGDCGSFYSENSISGNQEKVDHGYYIVEGNSTKLKFSLTGIYEYLSILEESSLYIEFLPPREIYERIVVIDAAGGGSVSGKETEALKEKDITLKIVQKLKSKLDTSDIKAYYTRVEDVYPSETERAALANGTKADMLIRIQVNADSDKNAFGISAVYNKEYFIPEFGNVELADLLEREVVTSINAKAAGLVPAGEEELVLQQAEIPAAAITVGYITNEKEAELLLNDTYLNKIADGIYNAIIKAYE